MLTDNIQQAIIGGDTKRQLKNSKIVIGGIGAVKTQSWYNQGNGSYVFQITTCTVGEKVSKEWI